MSKKPSLRPGEIISSNSAEILDRLGKFHVIQDARFRVVFSWLPALLIFLVLADWLIGSGSFSQDTFRMTSVMVITIILFSIQLLFDRLPKTLETIWRRDLITAEFDQTGANHFLAYLDQFQKMMNGKLAWTLGLAFAVGGLFATYPVQFYLKAGHFPYDFMGMISYYLWGHVSVIAPVLGCLVGLLVWRIGVIAYFMGSLGDRFVLRIQPNHPDLCGGFKPVGDLAFNIALILLVPSIFLAIWGFVTTFFKDPSLELYITLWGGLFRQWLVILSILSLFVFIQPLYKIHLQMDANARKIQGELDDLGQKIEALSLELRTQADHLTPQQGEEMLSTIEFMKKVYEENSHIPTWPFDWKRIIQFAGAQVVPILSLFGTSGPVVDLVKGLFVVAH